MNSSNNKLKPLNHKKSLNNQPPSVPTVDMKPTVKKTSVNTAAEKKQVA